MSSLCTGWISRAVLAIAAASPALAGAGDAWDAAARAVLLPALAKAYPSVAQWDVQPLIGKRQLERLRADAAPLARVARLGSRSVVGMRFTSRASETAVWYAVRGERAVLVAARDLAPGAALAPSDGVSATRDVMALHCEVLGDATMLQGMRVRSPLRADAAICAEHIEPLPAVARGERVTVHARVGTVQISASAIAQQDGEIGESLRVRTPSTGASYRARVTGRQEVSVDE